MTALGEAIGIFDDRIKSQGYVEKAIGNTGNLAVAIAARVINTSLVQWLGSAADVVQSLTVPVFMVHVAVEGTEDAKELGEEAKKEAAKNQLILILSLVFMIVPFLGEVATITAGLVQVARLIAIAGISDNAALCLQDIVENAAMAPLAILGLLSGGRLKAPKEFKDAAAFIRTMSGENIASLGTNFAKQDAMIQKIVRSCSRSRASSAVLRIICIFAQEECICLLNLIYPCDCGGLLIGRTMKRCFGSARLTSSSPRRRSFRTGKVKSPAKILFNTIGDLRGEDRGSPASPCLKKRDGAQLSTNMHEQGVGHDGRKELYDLPDRHSVFEDCVEVIRHSLVKSLVFVLIADMRGQLFSFTCVCFGVLSRVVSASCYYPDGSFPTDYVYVPCSGTEHTSCCIPSEGDQCLSNGLCYYPGGEYLFRGACTDKNWNSPGCFNHCTNKTNSYADSYDQIVKCGNDRYCCYSDGSTCCNDDSKVFTFSNLSVIKDLATTTRKTGGYSAPTAATATGTLQPSGSSVSRASTTSAEVKAQATGTAAFPTATSPSSQTTSDTSSATHTFSKTAIIVASVGAMLFFVLLVVAFWFFIRRHYRKKLSPSSKEQGFPLSSDGFQRLSDKSPRPVEVPAPLHAPPPLYQPPAYQSPPPAVHGAVEIDNSYLPPSRNQWGQPVFEAPAQPYRHV
ncbi:hypothetical protein FB567DRAFT_608132 [Paraphoma chrysanthemicola]|uniref:Uncharacterized protein n=1 Tax=Paraphoma chrysanthemicola TaxID=798071 RepID=A0A8K0VU15_9PLEO|nr:hypothetical protein FB567DRAFT_608132 [Paraphoma chrysanthemicola]